MSDEEYLFSSKFTPYSKDDIQHPDLTLKYLLEEMIKEEAQKLFRFRATKKIGVNLTEMYKSIILAASRVHWPESRGVREFWYNPIKPILYRVANEEYIVSIESKEERTGKPPRAYDAFDGVLSNMVKSNIVTYEQLGIVDFRTMRKTYGYETNANCWSNVVLFVEKDSAYHHLLSLKELLNITILSGGGVSKTACAEVIIKELQPGSYKIFTVTDYDPWGFYISDEAAQKLNLMGWDVELIRIALNPDQLDTDTIVQSQRYPVKLGDKAEKWCPLYGLPGPLGNKRYGFEIEALSGQPSGPKQLRKIVLEGMLKHLDEDDRIFEMTEEAWDDMPSDATLYYVDSFTWSCYRDIDIPMPLDEYLTPEIYNMRKRRTEFDKVLALAPGKERLEYVEDQIADIEGRKDDAISENYWKYERQIEDVKIEYIEPLEQQIRELTEEHIDPLEETREYHENIIRDSYRQALSPYEGERDDLNERLEEIEGEYDTRFSVLMEKYRKSRAIFAQSVYSWLEYNRDVYYDRGLEYEDFSMGVIRGFLEEACEMGETAQGILTTVELWDKKVPYSNIIEEMETHSMDEVMGRVSVYFEECQKKMEEGE